MADEENFLEIQGFQKSINMFSIFPDLLFSFPSRFSMSWKFDDDGIELLLKVTLLITPCILSSSCSMDEEDRFPSF